jgi:UDP-glucose 4-epimerase
MAFHRFCKGVLERRPLVVYGDGYQTRDFTFISDVVEANIGAATSENAIGHVMNIAGGSQVSLRYVIQLLREISGYSLRETFEAKQHGDVRDTFADTTLAKRLIGYRPVVSLCEGLAQEFTFITSLYENAKLPQTNTVTVG